MNKNEIRISRLAPRTTLRTEIVGLGYVATLTYPDGTTTVCRDDANGNFAMARHEHIRRAWLKA